MVLRRTEFERAKCGVGTRGDNIPSTLLVDTPGLPTSGQDIVEQQQGSGSMSNVDKNDLPTWLGDLLGPLVPDEDLRLLGLLAGTSVGRADSSVPHGAPCRAYASILSYGPPAQALG